MQEWLKDCTDKATDVAKLKTDDFLQDFFIMRACSPLFQKCQHDKMEAMRAEKGEEKKEFTDEQKQKFKDMIMKMAVSRIEK
jgi:hypothetical protein